jgi:6-pyruvoyltetrahydropterin/6-carboxytetrahydropterin synthase
LARYFFQKTVAQVSEMTAGRVRVKDCTLYETDTSFARYSE